VDLRLYRALDPKRPILAEGGNSRLRRRELWARPVGHLTIACLAGSSFQGGERACLREGLRAESRRKHKTQERANIAVHGVVLMSTQLQLAHGAAIGEDRGRGQNMRIVDRLGAVETGVSALDESR
jgi:hypothetical protein